jgi:hypothetical protein
MLRLYVHWLPCFLSRSCRRRIFVKAATDTLPQLYLELCYAYRNAKQLPHEVQGSNAPSVRPTLATQVTKHPTYYNKWSLRILHLSQLSGQDMYHAFDITNCALFSYSALTRITGFSEWHSFPLQHLEIVATKPNTSYETIILISVYPSHPHPPEAKSQRFGTADWNWKCL